MRIRLSLTPDRLLVCTRAGAAAAGDEGSDVTEDDAQALERAFASGVGTGLLHLGGRLPVASLAASEAFWRDFAKAHLTAALAGTVAPLTPAAAAAWLERAPPQAGGEYLDATTLQQLWLALATALSEGLTAPPPAPTLTMPDLLARLHDAWAAVGRVCVSLAENRNDAQRPFALLATYTTQLTGDAKPRHAPLARALKATAAAGSQVARITGVLKAAAARSDLFREWLESQRIFQPLALTVAEAHRFLTEVPQLEAAGVLARLPDWWNAAQPPRPRVTVTVGADAGQAAGRAGAGAILGFKAEVTLFGQPLTPEEWKKLQAAVDGLIFLRGRWVEVDARQIQQALDVWRASEELVARSGLTFAQAMRLLVGADLGNKGGAVASAETLTETVRPWSEVVAGPWLAAALAALRAPETAQPPDLGDDLKATLRPYQRAGVSWLWQLHQLGLGGCLADDMGLGKTIQVLAYLAALRRAGGQEAAEHRPHLIVAPATLVANWLGEAAKFTPGLRTFGAHPSQQPACTLSQRPDLGAYDLVVTSYGSLQRYGWLVEQSWDVVVLDEAQAIKNPQTQQTRVVKELTARHRLALTGTPVENRPLDLWSIFDFLNPGLLGSSRQFGDFVAARREAGYGALRKLVQPYVLRRLKSDKALLPDLPDKTEMEVACGLAPVQAALYQRVVDELKRELVATATSTERQEGKDIRRKGVVLSALLKLKQVCNHPALAAGHGEFLVEASGKLRRLVEIAEEIAARQERLLVFTQFREMTGVLDRELARIFRRQGCVLHGETPVSERQALVDRFQRPGGPPYFVLSLRAGGTGLTLTAASHVVHFDRWWNPAVEDQATDRAYRLGQHRNVLVHKLTCAGTIEARVAELMASKRQVAQDILAGGAELPLTSMSDQELLALVTLDIAKADL